MQHDEVVWQLINHGHCSFRTKTTTQNFCRNDYNVTGLCSRSSCPLANSRYATIREQEGRIYLYIKTAERVHSPKRMWQKIRLKKQYSAALEQIDEHLAFWPKFLVHKNKQRLTKVTQYLVRMRKLRTKIKPKLITMPARKERMLRKKEAKAEVAAQVERSIEKELLERLKSGTYGDIYNFPTLQYKNALKEGGAINEEEVMDEDIMEEVENEGSEEFEEFIEDEEDSDSDSEEVEWLEEDELDIEESDQDIEEYHGGSESSGSESSGSESSGSESSGSESSDIESESDGEGENRPQKKPPKRRGTASQRKGQRPRRSGRHVELEYEYENRMGAM
jgi:protein MAK16